MQVYNNVATIDKKQTAWEASALQDEFEASNDEVSGFRRVPAHLCKFAARNRQRGHKRSGQIALRAHTHTKRDRERVRERERERESYALPCA